MKSDEVKGYLYMGAAVVGAYLLYRVTTKGAAVASAVGAAINPANPDNVVNQGVTSLGQAISGDAGWTLGGWVYDLTHDDPLSVNGSGKGAFSWVSSMANDYAKYGGANGDSPEVSSYAFSPAEASNINKAKTEVVLPAGGILSGPSFNDTANGNWSWF